MTNYKDPKTYLSTQVSRRGKSGPCGVYLTNVTIVAEASTDYGYKASFDKCGPHQPPLDISLEDWQDLLVRLRFDNPQVPQTVHTMEEYDELFNYQFFSEGGYMGLNVFAPSLDTEMFEHLVCSCQDALIFASNFAGKIPTNIRFSIGYASMRWDNLAEEGEVQEQDLSF